MYMKKEKSKANYFNADNFVHLVLQDTKLLGGDPAVVDELSGEIMRLLNERIVSTVLVQFGDKELFLLENMLKDHPELDEIDVISILAENLPDLNELIVKTVNDLYEELVGDVEMIDQN
jgi:hypothetical protein